MNLKVSEIVGQFLDEYNLGPAEYRRAYSIAIRGWRELNWDIVGKNKQICLELSCDKTSHLPDDFISENSVGGFNECGQIETFDRLQHKPGCPSKNWNDRDNIRGDFRNDESVYPALNWSLGVGSYTSVGYYYIDKSSHTIFVNPNCNHSSVVLEYLSYTDVDGEYEINELAAPALLAYLDWKFSKGYKATGLSELREKERLYYSEKKKAKLRIKRLTVSDLNKAVRESVKMAIKS